MNVTAVCDVTIERHTPDVRAYLHDYAQNLLQQRDLLFQLKGLHHGPVHLIFPHIMQENIERMQTFFAQYNFPTKIYYTCKPNKSKVFIRQALKAGINIDVSSYEELVSALSVGFRGQDIGATNVKNTAYIRLAMDHGCLISVDNLGELNSIIAMHAPLRYRDPTRILVRLSDPKPKDRKMTAKLSKFGIAEKDLDEVMAVIDQNRHILSFQGLHFHRDNPLPDVHAGFIDHLLSCAERVERKHNLPSHLLDIGGGFRVPNVADPQEWSDFVEHVATGVLERTSTSTWNNLGYDMQVIDGRKLHGRAKMEAKATTKDYTTFFKNVMDNKNLRGQFLHQTISENLLTLMLEPGASLLGHAGFTLLRVNGTKKMANCDNAILVDGNIYNIASRFMPHITDFIHVPQVLDADATEYDAYIVDNLCNEQGILSEKCMYFAQEPKDGDLLIIPNTAAYSSDFEEASPHRHPLGKKIVVTPSQNQRFSFYDEEYYTQFVQG